MNPDQTAIPLDTGRIELCVYADQLRAGDFLPATGRTIRRVVHDGVYMRSESDQRTAQPFPRGKVEVLAAQADGTWSVAYWHKRTAIAITRAV